MAAEGVEDLLPVLAARMRFDAPVRVGWFRLSFCVADSDDKDIDDLSSLFSLVHFVQKFVLPYL